MSDLSKLNKAESQVAQNIVDFIYNVGLQCIQNDFKSHADNIFKIY